MLIGTPSEIFNIRKVSEYFDMLLAYLLTFQLKILEVIVDNI
jgi:hypothetical protein